MDFCPQRHSIHSGIAETVAQATLCDFQLDTMLQPHCLAISAKLRKRDKRYIHIIIRNYVADAFD